VDIEPIGGLYKTGVKELARYIGLPSRIIGKTPTAGLWPGQTDEEEPGIPYEIADRLLSMLEKQDVSAVKGIFPAAQLDRVAALLNANVHKRLPPQSCEVE
jgi:NAD+ synthase